MLATVISKLLNFDVVRLWFQHMPPAITCTAFERRVRRPIVMHQHAENFGSQLISPLFTYISALIAAVAIFSMIVSQDHSGGEAVVLTLPLADGLTLQCTVHTATSARNPWGFRCQLLEMKQREVRTEPYRAPNI
jgi:hypothetical protein